MTLRVLFVLMGATMFFPAFAFLCVHRSSGDVKWISRALRALAVIPVCDGMRLVVGNLTKLDMPIAYANWLDQTVSISTIVFAAFASAFFYGVYANARSYQEEHEND